MAQPFKALPPTSVAEPEKTVDDSEDPQDLPSPKKKKRKVIERDEIDDIFG